MTWEWMFYKRGDKLVVYPHALTDGDSKDILLATEDYYGMIHIRVTPEHRAVIAAAPDLLAACEAFFACAWESDEEMVALKAMRAAIAKARGGS